MRVSQVLQLSVWLLALCLARYTLPQIHPTSEERASQVPVSQLKVLSLGLVHLFKGVQDSQGIVDQHVEHVTEELEGNSHAVEKLRELGVQAGRTHRQVRKDLQVLTAQGDKLEKTAQDLKLELGAMVAERGDLELRMSRVLERFRSKTEPVTGISTLFNMSLLKVIIDSQSSRLTDLATELTNRDLMIDRNLQHIADLEQQVSRRRGGRPPSRSGGTV